LSDKIEEEIKAFNELGEREKVEYVRAVLKWLAKSVRWVWEGGNVLVKKKRFDALAKEVDEKKERLVVALLYAVKPEFKEEFVGLIEALVGFKGGGKV